MPLHDQMRQAALAELLAHREPRLTAANNQRLDMLDGHAGILFGCFITHAQAAAWAQAARVGVRR
jgi:hypothetical protein